MTSTRILTGITTSGTPHLGNYVGAIRPAVAASRNPDVQNFYFLADLHALIKVQDPAKVQRSTLEIAASWLACGLQPDHDRVWFYRQSDILETTELTWFLTCVASKGLLNRAHAYKAAVDRNTAEGQDEDHGVTAGLFMYPVLMAADILIFNAHKVPVGRDQIQHIEMARDFAQRFNHLYGEHFVLPEAVIEEHVATLPGLDGRKMSKSYDNTIPLFAPREQLKKLIFSIVTDSKLPGEPKDTSNSALFQIYQAFATPQEVAAMRSAFSDGIGWGDAKNTLFERIESEIAPFRDRYNELISKPELIEQQLLDGARTARERLGTPFIRNLRNAVGIRNLSQAERKNGAGNTKKQKAEISVKTALFRDKDGSFKVRVLDERGTEILISRGFKTPNEAKEMIDTLALLGLEAFSIENVDGTSSLMRGKEIVATFTMQDHKHIDPAKHLNPRLGRKFVISKRKNGEFQFTLKAGNGQIILSSEGYQNESGCKNGIESVKRNAANEMAFERKIASNGSYYFNLKASNGQVIGTSELYGSETSRENGIISVKMNAPDADVVDEAN